VPALRLALVSPQPRHAASLRSLPIKLLEPTENTEEEEMTEREFRERFEAATADLLGEKEPVCSIFDEVLALWVAARDELLTISAMIEGETAALLDRQERREQEWEQHNKK
jgi:hypothetical protein